MVRKNGHRYDLSRMDSDKLLEKFKAGRKHAEVERLRGAVKSKLEDMISLNKTRTNYGERLQKLIDGQVLRFL